MPDTAVKEPGTAIEAVPAAAIEALETNTGLKWADLTKLIAQPPAAIEKPKALPLPASISDDEKAAIEKLPEVFASVVPTEPRQVTPHEVGLLLEERSVLKTVEKLVGKRVDDIALTMLNHNDAAFEEGVEDDTTEVLLGVDGEPLRNKDGHIVRKAKVRADDPAIKTHFSMEARKGSPSIDLKKLEALGKDEEVDYITHADYLAMTTQTRVFDENKAILHLKKNPGLLRALREASGTGPAVIAVYQR